MGSYDRGLAFVSNRSAQTVLKFPQRLLFQTIGGDLLDHERFFDSRLRDSLPRRGDVPPPCASLHPLYLANLFIRNLRWTQPSGRVEAVGSNGPWAFAVSVVEKAYACVKAKLREMAAGGGGEDEERSGVGAATRGGEEGRVPPSQSLGEDSGARGEDGNSSGEDRDSGDSGKGGEEHVGTSSDEDGEEQSGSEQSGSEESGSEEDGSEEEDSDEGDRQDQRRELYLARLHNEAHARWMPGSKEFVALLKKKDVSGLAIIRWLESREAQLVADLGDTAASAVGGSGGVLAIEDRREASRAGLWGAAASSSFGGNDLLAIGDLDLQQSNRAFSGYPRGAEASSRSAFGGNDLLAIGDLDRGFQQSRSLYPGRGGASSSAENRWLENALAIGGPHPGGAAASSSADIRGVQQQFGGHPGGAAASSAAFGGKELPPDNHLFEGGAAASSSPPRVGSSRLGGAAASSSSAALVHHLHSDSDSSECSDSEIRELFDVSSTPNPPKKPEKPPPKKPDPRGGKTRGRKPLVRNATAEEGRLELLGVRATLQVLGRTAQHKGVLLRDFRSDRRAARRRLLAMETREQDDLLQNFRKALRPGIEEDSERAREEDTLLIIWEDDQVKSIRFSSLWGKSAGNPCGNMSVEFSSSGFPRLACIILLLSWQHKQSQHTTSITHTHSCSILRTNRIQYHTLKTISHTSEMCLRPACIRDLVFCAVQYPRTASKLENLILPRLPGRGEGAPPRQGGRRETRRPKNPGRQHRNDQPRKRPQNGQSRRRRRRKS